MVVIILSSDWLAAAARALGVIVFRGDKQLFAVHASVARTPVDQLVAKFTLVHARHYTFSGIAGLARH